MQNASTRPCRLCSAKPSIKNSHIIPKLVARAVAEDCAGYSFRDQSEPNSVVQDIIKTDLLCIDCEKSFNKLETHFAKKCFLPYFKEKTEQINIDENTFRLMVSVSWRALALLIDNNSLDPKKKHISEAEKVWREYLTGARQNIGNFNQYLVMDKDFDELTITSSKGLSKTYLKYVIGLSAVTFPDQFPISERVVVLAKMGPFILYGELFNEEGFHRANDNWISLKISPDTGARKNKTKVPNEIVKNIDNLLTANSAAMENLSDKQKEKRKQFIEKNILNSKAHKIIKHDIDIFNAANSKKTACDSDE